MKKTILVLTQALDPHATTVMKELERRNAQALRCDLSEFPQKIQLDANIGASSWEGSLLYDGQAYALEEIQSIWWRRPTNPDAQSFLPPIRKFVNTENLRALVGI